MSGVAVGLAWTYVGGDILFIEAALSEGKGELKLTGNLGNVMKESATTALTYLQVNAKKLGIDAKLFEKKNIHIHVPEGATGTKDGPSAGVTMLTALASAFYRPESEVVSGYDRRNYAPGAGVTSGGHKGKSAGCQKSGFKRCHPLLAE